MNMIFYEEKKMESIRIKVKISKKDIIYIDGLFESYENFGIVTTIDPKEGVVELLISPSFLIETKELLEALKKEIGLRII